MLALEVFHMIVAAGATLAVFIVLQVRRGAPADVLFLGALGLVTVCGVISPRTALEGFSNSALLTIAGLLVVASGLRTAGVLDGLGRRILGTARTERQALWRLGPCIAAVSAFVLNTAVVAMVMPVVLDWCRRHRISPSRLLIPISYLTILGGVCTLIGTSTTLVVNGELRRQQRMQSESPDKNETFVQQVRPMSLFEIGQVGGICALVGLGYVLFFAGRLLPDRKKLIEGLGSQRREYLVEMMVAEECPLIGKTVEAAGLRHLPGLFLIEIDREGEVLTPVAPEDVVHVHDRLVFTGIVSTIVDLEKIPGLLPAADSNYESHPQVKSQRRWTEVVLSRTSPLIGSTVREAEFRQRYNAAVVAVHRNGVRLTNKIGDIRLEPGDTLLLQTRSRFVAANRNSRDFYLISDVEDAQPRRHHKTKVAGGLAILLLAWLVAGSIGREQGIDQGWTSTAIAALTVGCLMVVFRCVRASDARSSIDLQTLITIAAALGLGRALQESGAALWVATRLVAWVGEHPYVLLGVIYLLTIVLTESLSNNAVAAMLLPLAIETARAGGHSPRPFVIAITVAASLSFVTPIGYQTNLMVMGPGGYRPSDYLRCGWPLAVMMAATALTLIPLIWTF